MGIPQVRDQVRRTPTEVLRAVFAGIGRMLMTADRPAAPPSGPQAARQPGLAQPGERQPDQASIAPAEDVRSGPDTVQSSAADSRWRSLDRTGNVRLLSAEEMADRARVASEASGAAEMAATSGAASPAADTAPETGTAAETGTAPETDTASEIPLAEPAGTAAASQPGVDLPLPSYDDLSLPSIRARLRGLDVNQLRILAEYEARNAERTDVLGMLERRIQKLESGS